MQGNELPAPDDDSDDEETDNPDETENPRRQLPSPAEIERITSGIRGIKKSSKSLPDFYHIEQDIIFPLLKDLLRLLEDLMPRKFNEPPVPKDKSTEEFCILIDFYTSALNNFCQHYLFNPRRYPTSDCLLLLAYCLQLCLMIVAGRNTVDWQESNDLLNEKGWKTWKNHIIVMISFAALFTSLQMLTTLFMRKWKRYHDKFLVHLKVLLILENIVT